MTDLASLLLILLVFYTVDCLFWLRPGSVAIVRRSCSRWALVQSGAGIGNRPGGLAVSNPLPGLDQTFVCYTLPIALSPLGLLSWAPPSIGGHGRHGKSISYTDMKTVERSGTEVVINGATFVRCSEIELAVMLVDNLLKLAPLSPAQREMELKELIQSTFNVEAARQRIDDFKNTTLMLRLACVGCFFYVFIALPGFFWHYGMTKEALPLVAGAFLISAMLSVGFYRIHASLFECESGERLSSSVVMALFPPSAIRAGNLLARRLLWLFHPLAVTWLLCDRVTFEDFARKIIVDIRNTVPPDLPDDAGADIEEWHRKNLEQTIVDFLQSKGTSIFSLLGPPARLEEATRSYCPRCRCQYVVTHGECSDCQGIALMPVKKDNRLAVSTSPATPPKG